MVKQQVPFEEFLSSVDPVYQDFVQGIHDYLMTNGCKATPEFKRSGYFVSYTDGKNKRAAVNFLFRKKGLIVRIYGTNANDYSDIIDSLPENMTAAIQKSPDCKRLTGTAECSPTCQMGNDFLLNGERIQKCRINCFMFLVTPENNPHIQSFIEYEMTARLA